MHSPIVQYPGKSFLASIFYGHLILLTFLMATKIFWFVLVIKIFGPIRKIRPRDLWLAVHNWWIDVVNSLFYSVFILIGRFSLLVNNINFINPLCFFQFDSINQFILCLAIKCFLCSIRNTESLKYKQRPLFFYNPSVTGARYSVGVKINSCCMKLHFVILYDACMMYDLFYFFY